MSVYRRAGVLAGAVSAAVAGAAFGGTTPGNTDARIAALEAQITELRSGSWTDREQTRAMRQEALADSETRASFRQGGLAGYRPGQGFFLSNEDGTFDVNIGVFSQFRLTANWKDSANNDNLTSDSTFGFENPRTQISLSGHAGSPDLTYHILGNFDVNGGDFELWDAYGVWALGGGLTWGWGQFKLPFTRETLVHSSRQLAADRSYADAVMSLGRSQGTWLGFEAEMFKVWGAFSDGAQVDPNFLLGTGTLSPFIENRNTPFHRDWVEWAFTGRGEVLLMGTWEQFDDFTSWSTDDMGIMVGGAVHWQRDEFGTTGGRDRFVVMVDDDPFFVSRDDMETRIFAWTLDGSFEFGMANAFTSFTGLHTSTNNPMLFEDFDLSEPDGRNFNIPSTDSYFWMVQGGFHVVPDKFELFARYDRAWLDSHIKDVQDVRNPHFLTFGVNYYFRNHNWKWTTDLIWALREVPFDAPGLGLLADLPGDDDQVVLRSQMQIAIP